MITFNATVNTQLARARLKKVEKAVEKQGYATVQQLVNMGKEFARWTAPKNTGHVYKTIQGNTKTTATGTVGYVYIDETMAKSIPRGIGPRGNKIGLGQFGANFNLVRWMHETGGRFKTDNPYGKAGKQHIPYHKATFMYRTRDYLNSKYRQVAKGNFDKLKIGR